MGRRRITIAGTIALLAMLAGPGPLRRARGGDEPLEARVKAAFVFNFVRFTEWPAEALGAAKDPLIIGIVGEGALVTEMQNAMRGKLLAEHPIEVRVFPAGQVGRCHVLYVSGAAGAARPILQPLDSTPVLTIGDGDDFGEAGGIIRMFLEEGKERFEINASAATRARLQISAKLLKLAKTVIK